MPADHVIRKTDAADGRVVENCALYYNANQKWLYLSQQQPTELLVFRQWDSNGASGTSYARVFPTHLTKTGVPHAAFKLPAISETSPVPPRESIEVRALVYF